MSSADGAAPVDTESVQRRICHRFWDVMHPCKCVFGLLHHSFVNEDLSSSDLAQLSFQDRAHPRLRAQVRCLHMHAKTSPAHGLLQTFLMAGAQWTERNRLQPKSAQCNSRAPCLDALRYPRSKCDCLQVAVHKLVREIALSVDSQTLHGNDTQRCSYNAKNTSMEEV